jgi:hypothetical protein
MFLSKRGTGTSTPFLQKLTLKIINYISKHNKQGNKVCNQPNNYEKPALILCSCWEVSLF